MKSFLYQFQSNQREDVKYSDVVDCSNTKKDEKMLP